MADIIINNGGLSNEDLISKFELKEDPDADDLLLGIYYHRGLFREKDYKMAEKYYMEAEKKGDIRIFSILGYIFQKQKKYDQAKYYFQKVVSLQKTGEKGYVRALNNLGSVYCRQKKYDQAGYYFQMAVQHKTGEKGYVSALNNLGCNYYHQKRYEFAEYYFLEALEMGNSDALYNLEKLYKKMDKYLFEDNNILLNKFNEKN